MVDDRLINLSDLENKIITYDKNNIDFIKKAYNYANKLHKNQIRASGEPYITHPLMVAYMLAEMHADSNTICAALLHDTIEDTKATKEEITKAFNTDIAHLVEGVTKMTQMDFSTKDEMMATNMRRIIVSIREDARIIIIKLIDRLHNMRTLRYKKENRQQEIALETLEIYVPMAYYIGAYKIKDELENISFNYLKPDVYRDIEKKLTTIQIENRKMLKRMLHDVKTKLNNEGIKCHAELHFKDTYSVYKKMITKSTIDSIHDLLGIKIIASDVKSCYLALMFIHSLYPPVSYKFKDYIVNSKTNLYKSIHTTVFAPNNHLVQFQIRTKEMDRMATYGLTSYWFKNRQFAKDNMQKDLEEKFQFFKSIKELDSSIIDNIEFVRQVKRELFSSNVYVFTTDGEVVELPGDSTPIDFAYKIHTDIGNMMVAAIVNDEVVPFDYKLRNNDRVRIITDKEAFVPKDDWLDKAITTHAKRKISEFIKDNSENIDK